MTDGWRAVLEGDFYALRNDPGFADRWEPNGNTTVRCNRAAPAGDCARRLLHRRVDSLAAPIIEIGQGGTRI
jgi:hypothetical protein